MRKDLKNKEEIKIFQQQLSETRDAIFRAKTIREMRFLQNKFNYLKSRMIELRKGGKYE